MGSISNRYFDWLVDKISGWTVHRGRSYGLLYESLYGAPYDYYLPMDANRYDDGIGLRYRFAQEEGFRYYEIATDIDNRPCSMLEMMVALSIRCEEEITQTAQRGINPGRWFKVMISSLGLKDYDDDHFNEKEIIDILERFVEMDYEPDGEGGLFYIPGCQEDLRNLEIIVQMYRYLEWKNGR